MPILKTTLLASVAILASGLAQAQTPAKPMACTTEAITMMETDAGKMADAAKKDAMMKEITMAKDMMGKKDEKACMTHMENAQKMMPKT